MIYGIGTDIVEIKRLAKAYKRHGASLLARILSSNELADFNTLAIHDKELKKTAAFLAKRWAAKEAFAKALGTGLRGTITLAGISIMHDAHGKPCLQFDKVITDYLASCNIKRVHLSLSDEYLYAVAFVVIEIE